MTKIRNILLQRKTEIETEIGPMMQELVEIDIAIKAMDKAMSQEPAIQITRPSANQNTAKEQVVAIIRAKGPVEMAAIATELRAKYRPHILNRDVSWNLSNLKKAGRLVQVGKKWALSPSEKGSAKAEPVSRDLGVVPT